MKRQKRLIGILLIMVMTLGLFSAVPVRAASANVTIALSASSLKVGDSVTVTVSVKCDEEIGSYSMAVTYDSSVIEYTGGSGSGGSGTVNIAGYGDGSAKTLKATLKFKAVDSGSTSISTTGGEVYTWGEEAATISHAGAKVSVEAQTTASKDNQLSSLSVSPGSLSPAFDAGTTSYTVSVGADVNELVVSAAARDTKAKVSVSGNKNLKAGENTVRVTVTAESGDKRTYKIVCTKAAKTSTEEGAASSVETPSEGSTETPETEETEASPEEPDQMQPLTVLIEGVTYTFAQSAQGLTVPPEFMESPSVYREQEILAFAGPGEAIKLVCLLTAEGAQVWFMYDELTGGFMTYCEMNTTENRLFIIKAGDAVEIPEGYRSVEMDLNGLEIPGFINESNTEIILVYAKKLNGDEGLYYYDTIENSFIRYIPEQSGVMEQGTEESTETMSDPKEIRGALSYDTLKLIAVGAVCLALILLFACAVVLGNHISLKKKLEKAPENEPDTENPSSQPPQDAPAGTKSLEPPLRTMKESPESELEEKAAALVAKLSLDEEKKPEQKKVSRDTEPVPIIQIDDDTAK